jgi:hypothetical protein
MKQGFDAGEDDVDMEQLGLHLAGPPTDGIDPRAVADGLAGLVKLANAVEGEEEDRPPPNWVICDLSIGSVKCSVKPAIGQEVAGNQRLRVVWQGAQQLRASVGIPIGWTEQAVQVFLELTKLTRFQGVKGAALTTGKSESIILDDAVRQHAERSLQGVAESLATVRGTIVRYFNDGGRREVGIREAPSRRSLRILFSPNMDHDLKVALLDDLPISVRGVLKRNSEGQKLALVAEHLTVLPASAQPPSQVRDMLGVLGKDWTGDLDSVEWARSQRG